MKRNQNFFQEQRESLILVKPNQRTYEVKIQQWKVFRKGHSYLGIEILILKFSDMGNVSMVDYIHLTITENVTEKSGCDVFS